MVGIDETAILPRVKGLMTCAATWPAMRGDIAAVAGRPVQDNRSPPCQNDHASIRPGKKRAALEILSFTPIFEILAGCQSAAGHCIVSFHF
ncbi:MAG: hypothetical protein H7327_14465 [Herminiimonas sp.]|nr:hypothetical protein [Herminiimonas sp.]